MSTADITQALADRVETALVDLTDQPLSTVQREVDRALANTAQCDLLAVVLDDPDLIGEDLEEQAYEIAGDLRHALSISGRHASEAIGAVMLRRILAVARDSLREETLAELTYRQDTAEARAEERLYYADEPYDRARDDALEAHSGVPRAGEI